MPPSIFGELSQQFALLKFARIATKFALPRMTLFTLLIIKLCPLIFGENETFRECVWNLLVKKYFRALWKKCFSISNFPVFSLYFYHFLNFNRIRRKRNFSFQKLTILLVAGCCTARRTSATLRG